MPVPDDIVLKAQRCGRGVGLVGSFLGCLGTVAVLGGFVAQLLDPARLVVVGGAVVVVVLLTLVGVLEEAGRRPGFLDFSSAISVDRAGRG